jgi:hypothetical protein
MAVSARAMDDGDQSARRADLRLQCARDVDRRVRALGPNQLRGGDDADEDNGNDERDLRASSRHGPSSISEALRPPRRSYATTRGKAVGERAEIV